MRSQIGELIKESERRSKFYEQQAEIFHKKAEAEGVQIQILSDRLRALEIKEELLEFKEVVVSGLKA